MSPPTRFQGSSQFILTKILPQCFPRSRNSWWIQIETPDAWWLCCMLSFIILYNLVLCTWTRISSHQCHQSNGVECIFCGPGLLRFATRSYIFYVVISILWWPRSCSPHICVFGSCSMPCFQSRLQTSLPTFVYAMSVLPDDWDKYEIRKLPAPVRRFQKLEIPWTRSTLFHSQGSALYKTQW